MLVKKYYDPFVTRLAARFKRLRVGSHTMDLDCGPLISENQKKRVQAFIEQAKREGIPVLAEAQIAEGTPAGGYYVAPVLFGPVPQENRLACDEVFGPVLSAIPFDDEADAVRLANSTRFGLVAGIWTRDGGRQIRVAKNLQCGQVFVNSYGAGPGVELPFGGVKKSGHGREKGMEALHEFSPTKTRRVQARLKDPACLADIEPDKEKRSVDRASLAERIFSLHCCTPEERPSSGLIASPSISRKWSVYDGQTSLRISIRSAKPS